jgi:16S rRNA C1402 (ribose-2'-O) methylase RsmI
MLYEPDSRMTLVAIESNDIIIFEYSKRVSKLLLVDVVQAWNGSLLTLLRDIVKQIAIS